MTKYGQILIKNLKIMYIIDAKHRSVFSFSRNASVFLGGVTLWLFSVLPCSAANLLEVYQAALTNDAVYQAALATRLAQREALPQSMAALFPAISAQANVAENYRDGTPTGGLMSPAQRSLTRGYRISIDQPLFAIDKWIEVKQAKNRVAQADLALMQAKQALILRVVKSYVAVLLANDTLRLTQAEKTAYATQLEQVQKRFQVGDAQLTMVYTAKAAYDQSLAASITAQNALRNSQESLRQLTTKTYSKLAPFKHEIPWVIPQPASMAVWVTRATQHNLSLALSRYQRQLAEQAIKLKAAGHLPTLSLVGSYGRDTSQIASADQNHSTIGLQLAVPIFAGGSTVSATRQAQYEFQKANANFDDQYRQVIVETRQTYNNILADISKLQAEQQAIQSARLSLSSTEASFKAGTQTIVEVLLAEQAFYQAQRNAAQDQYQYVLDTLILKQKAGSLQVADIQQLNQWLIKSRAGTFSTQGEGSSK